MDINVKLTTTGVDTGPTFEVKYWDTATLTFIILDAAASKASLIALPGVDYTGLPITATYVRVTSIGDCINSINLTISSTTTTTTSTSTSTTTTTIIPDCVITGTADEF